VWASRPSSCLPRSTHPDPGHTAKNLRCRIRQSHQNGRKSRVFSRSNGAARTRKQTHRSTGVEHANLSHLLSEHKRRTQGVQVENSTLHGIPRLPLLDAKDVLQGHCRASTRVFWRPRMSMGERACVDMAHVGPVLTQGKAHDSLLRRGRAQ